MSIYSYEYNIPPPGDSSNFLANSDEIRPQFQSSTSLVTDGTGAFNSSLAIDVPAPVNATTDQLDNIPLSSVQGFKEIAEPWYEDQVMPFDVTLAAANEYGAAASAKIYGVEILNTGFGTSVDDSVLEQQATFVARSVLCLQAVGQTSLISMERCGMW